MMSATTEKLSYIQNAAKTDLLENDPLWYKDAIIYELHVKSFYDSNGDGIGDLQGIIEKIDHIKDLGITAIWLLPFYPSPLKDDGYDIMDYFSIHPDYGDLHTFRRLLREAHRRSIRIITELVLGHTSDRHPWFQRARRSKPGSVWRDFYVWSDTPNKYAEARIIFKDFETSNWTWDPVANAYYWHRFYSHQPDLNYDNTRVQKEILRVIDFWLDMGVDGLRLDAVPYLYEREGTNCENLPETHAFLKELRAHVDGKFKNRMLLAEANQWPEDAVAYFGDGDECHMAFHFPLMPRMFMAVQMENRFPIIDILDQTPKIPETCQWAIFLRNHDELTLEMVTDEERDYMYRVYATDPRAKINLGIRRRLSPLLGNNRRMIELMNVLLFSLPGTPSIYYGDEIGMGDNYYLGDRNGVRTPMQWNAEKNAGFSDADPRQLYLPVIVDPEYHYRAVNVARQEMDQFSLLWWMRRTIALRSRFKAFGRGGLGLLRPDNPKVMAFIRKHDDEIVLVVVNLSRYTQYTELDLSDYADLTPHGLFSGNIFRTIQKEPYPILMGPYDYYWFSLRKGKAAVCATSQGTLPIIWARDWSRLFEEIDRGKFEEEILPNYLVCCCSLLGGEWRTIIRANILEAMPISKGSLSYLLILRIEYTEGLPEMYLLPLSFATKERSEDIRNKAPQSLIAWMRTATKEGVIYDGSYDEEFRQNLLNMMLHKRRARGEHGELIFRSVKTLPRNYDNGSISSDVFRLDQGVTYIEFKDRFFMKLYRSLNVGVNHGLDITRYLTEHGFPNVPPFEGEIEYRQKMLEPISIAMLQGFVHNEGNSWSYTMDEIDRYFDRVLARKGVLPPEMPGPVMDMDIESIPSLMRDLIGGVYLEMVRLLGKRTAEMHLILAQSDEPDFAPEPFTVLYQRSMYQSMRISAYRMLQSLSNAFEGLPDGLRSDASKILGSEKEIMDNFKAITQKRIKVTRIKIHGNYLLGHLLYTGKDFYIFGFDDRAGYILAERGLKRSPIRDVASMMVCLRSAARSVLMRRVSIKPEDSKALEPWSDLWSRYASSVFLGSYLNVANHATFLPLNRDEFDNLLKIFLLDRAIHELGDALEAAPGSVGGPIIVLSSLLKEISDKAGAGASS
jgi:maltose alpha-D-glucosyltransferase/alpha-amylase